MSKKPTFRSEGQKMRIIESINKAILSGKTTTVACQEHGVAVSLFHSWRKKLKTPKHETIILPDVPKMDNRIEKARLLIGLALEELNRL